MWSVTYTKFQRQYLQKVKFLINKLYINCILKNILERLKKRIFKINFIRFLKNMASKNFKLYMWFTLWPTEYASTYSASRRRKIREIKATSPKVTQLKVVESGNEDYMNQQLKLLSCTSCPNTSRWIFIDWLNVVSPTVIKLRSLKCNMSQSKYLLGVQLQFPAESMPAPRNTWN